MKIIVPIKRVVDYNVKVRPLSDQSDVDLNNVKMAMNPFCEIAIEEAVRLKEAGTASEVIAVTVGTSASQEQLRTALALGADRAILIETEALLEPLAISKALSKVIEKEAPQLIILGKQAIDGDSASVTREIDGGLQTIKVSLPAIVTTDLRLNEPRYASLPNIMKAKKKEMDVQPIDSLGVDIAPRLELISVEPPATRAEGIKVESVEELVSKLKNEAKVIS